MTTPAEVQAAINSSIIPNNAGRITATVLAGILTSIVALFSLYAPLSGATFTGNVNLSSGLSYQINGTSVLGLTGSIATIPTQVQTTTTGPTWASYSNIWNGFASIVGSYPSDQMFGNNAVGIAQGVTGAIEVPASSAAGNHASGVAGYAHTLSTSQGAVGTFGFGGIGVAGGSGWGFNTVTSNALSPNPSDGNGFDGGAVYGYELDFNIVKKAASATPNVPVRGIYMIGASTTAGSSTIVRAIDIDGLNSTNTKIPWLDGFYTNDGATTRGVNLGALSVNTGATSSGSQPMYFNSYLSGAQRPSYIVADPFGNLTLNPYSGSSVSIPSGSSYQINGTAVINNTGGHVLAKLAVASLPTCNAGAEGTLYAVTDANSATFNAAVAAGGANHVMAFCNGSSWTVH